MNRSAPGQTATADYILETAEKNIELHAANSDTCLTLVASTPSTLVSKRRPTKSSATLFRTVVVLMLAGMALMLAAIVITTTPNSDLLDSSPGLLSPHILHRKSTP